jgi:nucleoid DNA-binding protein
MVTRAIAVTEGRPAPELQVIHLSGVAYDGVDMVKADLIRRAVEASSLESLAAREAVDALFESVASALARGERLVLRRFGVFHTAPRKTGVARNPRTNEPVGIPRGRVVRFRPAPGLPSFPSSG